MFRGTFYHYIDAKGRTSLPSRFRDALQAAGEAQLVITHFYDESLVAFALSDWEKLEQKIGGLSMMSEEAVAFQRFFLSGAAECTLDKLGRILIPPHLRAYARLDKEIVFVSMVKRFEIWDRQRWEETFLQAAGLAKERRPVLYQLGVF